MKDPYVSVREYKNRYTKSTLSGTQIRNEIDIASRLVEEYCNTKFRLISDRIEIDFSYKFYAPKAPLRTVTDLFINKRPMIENRDFYVYQKQRTIEFGDHINTPTQKKKAVFVKYIYGYEKVPQTVKEVILDLIHLNEQISTGTVEIASSYQTESWEDYSYTKYTGKDNGIASIRNDVLSRLDPYVVPDIDSLPDLGLKDGNVSAMLL